MINCNSYFILLQRLDSLTTILSNIKARIQKLQEEVELLETGNGTYQNIIVQDKTSMFGDVIIGAPKPTNAIVKNTQGNLTLNGLVLSSSGSVLINPGDRTCSFSTINGNEIIITSAPSKTISNQELEDRGAYAGALAVYEKYNAFMKAYATQLAFLNLATLAYATYLLVRAIQSEDTLGIFSAINTILGALASLLLYASVLNPVLVTVATAVGVLTCVVSCALAIYKTVVNAQKILESTVNTFKQAGSAIKGFFRGIFGRRKALLLLYMKNFKDVTETYYSTISVDGDMYQKLTISGTLTRTKTISNSITKTITCPQQTYIYSGNKYNENYSVPSAAGFIETFNIGNNTYKRTIVTINGLTCFIPTLVVV